MFFWNSSRVLTGSRDFSTSYFLDTSPYLDEDPYLALRTEESISFVSMFSGSMERIALHTSIVLSEFLLTMAGVVSEVKAAFSSKSFLMSIFPISMATGFEPSFEI